METRDGFIVGVYNYCDRWCERCAFTGRCRVFADEQRMAFELAGTGMATQTPGGRDSTPVLRSLGALVATMEEMPDDLTAVSGNDEEERTRWPRLTDEESALVERVMAVGERLWNAAVPEPPADDPQLKDAIATIHHFAFFLCPKVHRALEGRERCEEDGLQSDALGSAKVALLAIEQVSDAWLRLAEGGVVAVTAAAPVLTELQAIARELERRFPRARDFVRPGFDEPREVAMLEWHERG